MADVTNVTVGAQDLTEVTVQDGQVSEILFAGKAGPAGVQGPAGQGVPVGGTTGQVLAKTSNTDYDTDWVAQSGGGVASVPRPPIASRFLPKMHQALSNAGGTCGAFEQLRANFIPTGAACTISSLSIQVFTGAANVDVRLGFYAVAANGDPGALIQDLGTVSVASGGTKTIDFSGTPIAVPAEGIYMANCWQTTNTTFQLRAYGNGSAGGLPTHIYQPPTTTAAQALSVPALQFYVDSVSGALPANPTWLIGNAFSIPMYAIEVVSVP